MRCRSGFGHLIGRSCVVCTPLLSAKQARSGHAPPPAGGGTARTTAETLMLGFGRGGGRDTRVLS
jgi:hypothetical protein